MYGRLMKAEEDHGRNKDHKFRQGKASHTPVILPRRASRNAAGIMRAKPLETEIICAGMAWSVEVKNRESRMLIPAKGMAVKYSFMPGTAICLSSGLPSLLKICTTGAANQDKAP